MSRRGVSLDSKMGGGFERGGPVGGAGSGAPHGAQRTAHAAGVFGESPIGCEAAEAHARAYTAGPLASLRIGVSVLALALLVAACAAPTGSRSSGSDGPRVRCLGQPGRGESYSSDRALFFLFCVESP